MTAVSDESAHLEDIGSDGEHNQPNEIDLFGNDEEGGDEDENAGQEAIKVEPKKRVVRNPRPRLTVDTLRGQRGIHTIEEYFKEIEFKGNGHEKDDLNEIMRRLQHWGHRMYPSYKFDDILTNIERLGKKQALQLHMNQYRLGQLDAMKSNEGGGELVDMEHGEGIEDADEPYDEFDALLGEQIAISKLDSRMQRHHTSTTSNLTLATPSFNRNIVMSTPYSAAPSNHPTKSDDTADYAHPLSPAGRQASSPTKLTSEQMARIAENRRQAQQRLREKLQAQTERR